MPGKLQPTEVGAAGTREIFALTSKSRMFEDLPLWVAMANVELNIEILSITVVQDERIKRVSRCWMAPFLEFFHRVPNNNRPC